MKAIVAMDKNRGIGKNGALPWPSIKEDFDHFREFTMGKKLIVGKNTFDTLPFLKNREILVLTREDKELSHIPSQHLVNNNNFTGKIIYESQLTDLNKDPDIIVAGGAKTYELMLPHITEFYVTHVNGIYNADVFMPEFEHLFNSQEIIKEFDGHRVIKYS